MQKSPNNKYVKQRIVLLVCYVAMEIKDRAACDQNHGVVRVCIFITCSLSFQAFISILY